MEFRPLHDRVLVRRVEAEEKTAGGVGRLRLPEPPQAAPAPSRPLRRTRTAAFRRSAPLGWLRRVADAQPTAMRRGFASAVLGRVRVSTPSSSCAPMRPRSTLSDSAKDRAQCPTPYSV